MEASWANRRVLVTGGGGFLGRELVEAVRKRGAEKIFVPRSAEYDLRTEDGVRRALSWAQPNLVIHLAGLSGGIGANRARPAEMFYDNAVMGIHLMEQSRRAGVDKFVMFGSVCSYPKFTPAPFREEDLWNGYPEDTNAAYGLAKKMLLVQGQAYRQQYGFNAIHLIAVNLYGPGDKVDPASSHVIPALVRKCVEAREARAHHIDVWGSGEASREFLFVADAAEAVAMAAEGYDGAEPVNLGSGQEVTIRALAEKIALLTGFKGELRWDASKPDGQPRRVLDVSKAAAAFGFRAAVSLDDGLQRTVEWFESEVSPMLLQRR